jgi:hypothetical protein
MLRHWLILTAVGIASTLYDQRGSTGDATNGHSVILVVSDGLRWQEVFSGADSALLFGDPAVPRGYGDAINRKYWRATARERRDALMPFVWRSRGSSSATAGSRAMSTSPTR